MIAKELAEQVLTACRARGLKLATVESCTGGLIGAALTDIPGSSDVVECGFITYANSAKTRLVGVSEALLARYGAVSAQVARAMAEGGVKAGNVDIAVAVSGIAGPGGGTAEKPVGLVHLAVAVRGAAEAETAADRTEAGTATSQAADKIEGKIAASAPAENASLPHAGNEETAHAENARTARTGNAKTAPAASSITILHYEARFGDIGREAIRLATVKKALEMVLKMVRN